MKYFTRILTIMFLGLLLFIRPYTVKADSFGEGSRHHGGGGGGNWNNRRVRKKYKFNQKPQQYQRDVTTGAPKAKQVKTRYPEYRDLRKSQNR